MSALALPASWSHRRLRFDVYTNSVKSELTLSDDAEVSFVPMDAVGELGGLRLEDTKSIADVYTGYTYFRDGDVCIAKITPCFENGKGALAAGLTNGVAFGTTELHIVRSRPTLDTKFLFYISIAHDFRSIGGAEMLGAGGQKRVPERFIKDWRAPLPPIDTQKRIAAFLDEKTAQIDGLIAKKQALLERLAEKRQAIITQAVTKGLNPAAPTKPSGIDWLGDIPAHWEVKRLKFGASKIGSGITPRGGASVYVNEGVMLLRSQNIHFDGLSVGDVVFIDDDTDSDMTETRVKYNDVLLNITGASIGRCCVFDRIDAAANVNQHVCIIRLAGSLLPVFLSRYLSSEVGQLQIDLSQNGASREGLNFGDLGRFNISMPPLYEQEKIGKFLADRVNQFKAQTLRIEESIQRLDEYRSALITAAVTGQIEGLR